MAEGLSNGDETAPTSTSENGEMRSKACQVCGEEIAKFKGLHYGGLTCYSCRAFFRRCHSADRRQPFVPPDCKNGGGCAVSVKSRRKCAKCRYDLCRRAGMNPAMVLSKEEKEQRFRKYYEKKALKEEQKKMQETTNVLVNANNNKNNNRSQKAKRKSNNNKKVNVVVNAADPIGIDGIQPEVKSEVMDDPSFEDPKTMSDSRLLELCLQEVDKILQDCEQPLPKLTLAPTAPTTQPTVPATPVARTVTLLQPRNQPPQQQPQQQPQQPQMQTTVIPRNILAAVTSAAAAASGQMATVVPVVPAGTTVIPAGATVVQTNQQQPCTIQFNSNVSTANPNSTYVTLQPADQNYWSGNVVAAAVAEGSGGGGGSMLGATAPVSVGGDTFRNAGEKYTLERL